MSADIRRIALNEQRARYIADHWEDAGPSLDGMPTNLDIAFEIGCIRRKIDELMKERPDMAWKLADFNVTVGTRLFWENLPGVMDGTHFTACGLDFKVFEYYSALQPLWWLEGEPGRSGSPPSSYRPPRMRKWGCHPLGCLGRIFNVFFKFLLPAVCLVLFGIHLWSSPTGDAPKPEPAEPKPVVAEKKAEAQPKAPTAAQPAGALAVGTRVVAKKAIPIYRFNEEKKPVVAGRVPPGTVVEVTGTVNAKVVKVSVELPNGKRGKGMARIADLKE